jgi:hypothetical protein
VNSFTHFRVKTAKDNAFAVYDAYFERGLACEYELFKKDFATHPKLQVITDIVDQILKPKKMTTILMEDGRRIPVVEKLNAGFFRNETPATFKYPPGYAGEKNVVAIPGKSDERLKVPYKPEGLRLICLLWGQRTLVLLNGYDKKGFKAAYQKNPRLNALMLPFLKVYKAIVDALDWEDYSVNQPNVGFTKRNETAMASEVDLSPYIK